MAKVSLKNINKVYDNNVQAVFSFNLEIEDGEFVVLVGPSGCGKSTTLRMIAGLEEITDGELYIDGKYSNDVSPKNRDLAMVFQNYALYPHMSVYQNMAFGLKNRKVTKEEIDKRIKEAAKILNISEYLNRKPKALSGGQCQRVALGRAIVRNAALFLMDEPLSNLDAKLRVQMRSEIIKLHRRLGSVTIYVTHDQTEAMTMADRIVVMNKGYIQQIGAPREIYLQPSNKFVAGFIGSPAMNFITANYLNGEIIFANKEKLKLSKDGKSKHDEFYKNELEKSENDFEEFVSSRRIDIQAQLKNKKTDEIDIENDEEVKKQKAYIDSLKAINQGSGHEVIFGVRPEDIIVSKEKEKDSFETTVDVVELLGNEQILHIDLFNQDIQVIISAKNEIKTGDKLFVKFAPEYIHVFDTSSEKSII